MNTKVVKPGAPKSANAKTEAPAPIKRNTDWQAVERDYRTSQFTLRELATKHGVSHQAIAKQAKKNAWTQDLAIAIKQATNAKLVQDLVDTQIAIGGQQVANAVLVAAEVNKQVILGHRSDLKETRDVAMNLLGELASTSMLKAESDKLAEVLTWKEGDKKPTHTEIAEARKLIYKALDVGNRIQGVKALAETLNKLQAGERKAFGMSEVEGDDDIPGVLIKDMTGRK